MVEPVRHPAHYTKPSGQVWDVLDEWFPRDPLLWQAGKYLARWNAKGDPVDNLQKAIDYIQRRIDFLKFEQPPEGTIEQAAQDATALVVGVQVSCGGTGSYPAPSDWDNSMFHPRSR